MLRKKYFSKYKEPADTFLHFKEMQLDSFQSLITDGLKELFQEFSPIHDYTGKEFTLEITGFSLDKPKYDEYYAKENKLTLEAPLKIKTKLTNKELNQIKEQEVFLADFPLMTSHGTFIINGVERVIVPQLIRSFGVYFTADEIKGKKYFGAKIIPSRGAWIEIKTELDNAIYARIDKKRKIPITSLLRIFGAENTKEIENYFSKIDKGEISYIKKTLEKDPVKTAEEAYVELYKRLRPGELASYESSRDFIKAMFDSVHYDLSMVGRYKVSHRLGLSLDDAKTAPRIITLSDLLAIVSKIIELNNTSGAQPDDIDHLGNRRVRTISELLQQRLRVGMTRMKRNIQDRMSTLDSVTLSPGQLINNRLIIAVLNAFFSTNPLSQFMSQKNDIDELEHLRRLTALGPGGLTRERAGFEVRDVHPSHYGRICPIETPEGSNIGLVLHQSVHSRLNEYGILETPYRRIKNGKITDEIVFLDAFDEAKYNIAHAGIKYDPKTGEILEKEVEARVHSRPGLIPKEKVDFIDLSANQAYSVTTNLIPFLENDDATRALMGANMQKQAIPCIKPAAPLVATGMEDQACRGAGRVVICQEDGVVEYVDASKIIINPVRSKLPLATAETKFQTSNRVKEKGGKKKTYNLINFLRSNDFTAIHQRPSVNIGDKVSKGDVIADNYSSENGQMALGQNLLVAFLSWRGANFEDAIIISERLVREDFFTSVHIEEFSVNIRDTKLGPEINTYDIPNVGENKLKDLDEEGIVRIGAEVRADDILVGKISPKGEAELTPEEHLLRSIFGEKARDVKDTSLRLDIGKQGRIIGIKVFSREQGDKLEPGIIKKIFIEIAQLRKISVGDKLAGRHGNKGVISKILPIEDMPYLEDGTPVDIILNPLGVPGRMNLGQILETHLGWAAEKLGYQAITPALSGATEEEIKEEIKKAGIPEDGKVKLYDGRTGESFDQRVTVGNIYMMKLDHMAEDKIHMRSIGPYSLITQQPLKGKAQGGGQRFGEMEVWALEGYGAAHALQEMLTIKSDDILGRSAVYNSIIRGEKFKSPNLPASFHVLLHELKGLALDVELKGIKEEKNNMDIRVNDFKSISLKLSSPEKILSWSRGEVTKPETINYRTQRAERNGLFCEKIFGPEKDYECYCGKYRRIRYKGIICEKCGVEVTRSIVRRERMGHISLAVPVSHIWFLRGIPSRIGLILDVPLAALERVIYFGGYIITKVNNEAKAANFKKLDSEYKAKLKNIAAVEKKENLKNSFAKAKTELDSLVLYKVLMPPEYYQLSMKYGEVFEVGIGAEAIYNIFKNINLEEIKKKLKGQIESANLQEQAKLLARLNLIKSMQRAGIRPEWMFLTVIPVVPPALRPMVALDGGRHATSDLNDLYRRVINRNNRLKKLMEIKAPEVICRNEKRILQEAVDALIDNSMRRGQTVALSQAQKRPLRSLADMLKGKQGRFRQNLLGKRVDYSARSVIVIGPELRMHQCGLPKHMALELFRPFVITELLKREMVYNIRGAGRLIDEKTPEVWAILEDVIKDKYVLLNRAPTLHRLGIQAFQPVLIEGNAIQIHPLVCQAFNADFDGDQMAVHVPLSPEAQKEARDIMASIKNLLKPSSGEPIVNPSQDIVGGCYWLTRTKEDARGEGLRFSTPNEAIMAYDFGEIDIRAKIKVLATDTPKYKIFNKEIFETTVGRLLFNGVIPNDYSFINEEMTKKSLAKLISKLIEKYGVDAAPAILDKIKNFGFEYATLSGMSWGINDLIVPPQKKEIVKEAEKEAAKVQSQLKEGLITNSESHDKLMEIWQEAKTKIDALVPETLDKEGSVYTMVNSAARGNWGQVGQMSGMKGLVVNPAGRIIDFPVISSYKEGLNVLEYFITTHGARKGEADTALKTSKAGYLTRRLVDVSQDVIINEKDCGTKEGIKISKKLLANYGKKLSSRIFGRVLAKDAGRFKKGHLLTLADAKEIEASGAEEVYIFSPISCQAKRGVCQKCYGYDLGSNIPIKIGETIGIVAAQAIGEPGTQLTLRTFHTGGIAAGGDITTGLPRVEEIFELRLPRSPAVICEEDGEVLEIKEKNEEKIAVIGEKEYIIPFGRLLIIKKKDKVQKGDLITDGAVDIRLLFAIAGKEKTQDYIINEVSKVYTTQGASINDKHIEVIARQMFSRCRIKDPGDTNFNKGKIVDREELLEENEHMKKTGRKEAKGMVLVMPISRVSLSTTSFLSAASFQDTARVLIKVATEGAEDKLRGLKENVIIGRLIPAGTGFRKEYIKEETAEEE